MRRLMTSRAPAIVTLTLLLALAAVTRGAVGYDISPWSVGGGGATFSAGASYSLGGTIGQPVAGQISGGAYTLGSGFWGGGAVALPKPHGPVFLPLVSRIRAPSLEFCDLYEPNNSRYDDATPLTSTDELTAKICANDVEPRYHPKYDFEDNYTFVTTTSNPIQVKITLQPKSKLVSHIAIAIYANRALGSNIEGCFKTVMQAQLLLPPCSISNPGRYTVRLYSDGTVDDLNSYLLQVIYQ
jgi:hypothetical protein